MTLFYKSRKQQMQAFAKTFKKGEMSLSELLESACTCGAAEERHRSLDIIRKHKELSHENKNGLFAIELQIQSESVAKVLGYEK